MFAKVMGTILLIILTVGLYLTAPIPSFKELTVMQIWGEIVLLIFAGYGTVSLLFMGMEKIWK